MDDRLFRAQLTIPRLTPETVTANISWLQSEVPPSYRHAVKVPYELLAKVEECVAVQPEAVSAVTDVVGVATQDVEVVEREIEHEAEERQEAPVAEPLATAQQVEMPAQKANTVVKVVVQDIMTSAEAQLEGPSPSRRKMQQRAVRSQKNGQTYQSMVKQAVEHISKEFPRKGASLPAIKKYLIQTFNLNVQQARTNTLVNKTLKEGMASGCFVKVKGRGLSGSFKLGVDRKEKERVQRIAKEKRQKEKERERRFVDRELTKLRHKEESLRLKEVMKVRIARRKQHQRLLETGASVLDSSVFDRIQNVLEEPKL